MIDKIIESAKNIGIELNREQGEKLEKYYKLLIEWNEKMNLTAITEPDEVIEKHFTDSLTCLETGLLEGRKTVIDVGCGAGFPSIPLKIARPELEFTLVDSLNKRIGFLNAVIEELGLKKITAVHMRAEESGRSEYRDSFDVCVARAVASLPVLCEFCMPHVKSGGYFIAMKGKEANSEAESAKNAVSVLGGRIESVKKTSLPEAEHYNVVIKKLSETNKKYPRKPGMPGKKPL